MTRNYLLVGLGLSLLLADCAHAGAWVQEKHGYYFKFSASYLYTTKEFNYEGKKQGIFAERTIYEDTAFRDFGVSVYSGIRTF